MLRHLILVALILPAVLRAAEATPAPMKNPTFGLVIHGGAGVILRENMPPALEAEYRAKLGEALAAGYAILDRGGPALDAVVAAIRVMEDSPLFNAGKGAVLNAEGVCELDASIMDGRTLAAGAVAGLHHIRNPITLARDVMEKSGHVLMIGDGAETYAKKLGYALEPAEYFITEVRRQQLEQARRIEAGGKPSAALLRERIGSGNPGDEYRVNEFKYGTVGCVALDRAGNLAAGTSTGGLTNKRYGRVGDSAVIGAGTYASNATCALSATGQGEYFIREVVGHDVAAQMAYRNASLADAAADTIRRIGELGGSGGVIALDRHGNVAMPFNTPGMYRGVHLSTGQPVIEFYGPDAPQ
ncbi:MAG: isoaspartyl peptidase/L-asparaginase [Verrucomicrobia bacterium]|nr:isoaspartyl peptidase/L-asparaginase [Verrucomicrobiota bacterium]